MIARICFYSLDKPLILFKYYAAKLNRLNGQNCQFAILPHMYRTMSYTSNIGIDRIHIKRQFDNLAISSYRKSLLINVLCSLIPFKKPNVK